MMIKNVQTTIGLHVFYQIILCDLLDLLEIGVLNVLWLRTLLLTTGLLTTLIGVATRLSCCTLLVHLL